jgi:nucleoside permease NupC
VLHRFVSVVGLLLMLAIAWALSENRRKFPVRVALWGMGFRERSLTIATYALCGFANLGSIAILVGGLGGIDPQRRGEFARLGWKSLIAGTLAAFSTACVAGILAPD